MALEVTGMARSFTFKKGSGTATVHGPVIKDDKAVYEFKTTIGTKG